MGSSPISATIIDASTPLHAIPAHRARRPRAEPEPTCLRWGKAPTGSFHIISVLLTLEGVMTPLINNIPTVTVAAGVLIVLAIAMYRVAAQ